MRAGARDVVHSPFTTLRQPAHQPILHTRESTAVYASQLMLLLARTLRLGYLAFRNGGGIPSSSTLLLRPAAHPLIKRPSPSSQTRCCSTSRLSMSGDTTGGADGGVIQPRVPVSSITAFGQGLGQEQLQVRTAVVGHRTSSAEQMHVRYVQRTATAVRLGSRQHNTNHSSTQQQHHTAVHATSIAS